MTELNREIIREIRKLDCDNSMKLFLEKMLQYELNLIESDSNDGKKAIGVEYKARIAEFSKQWGVDDEV